MAQVKVRKNGAWITAGLGVDRSLLATIEELAAQVQSATVSATSTVLVFAAPFLATLAQASIVSTTAVGASDTNYWTVELRRYRAGAVAVIGTKTTRTTGGEAIGAFVPWTFDAVALTQANQALQIGDVVALTFTPTGTPAAITTPLVSVRYEPS